MNKRTKIIASIVVGAVIAVGAGVTVTLLNQPASVSAPPVAASTPPTASPDATPIETTATPVAYDTAASLLYLIEEEKLAHDVYVTLGETWGANIFSNISASETTHQSLLVPLLDARGLADPRSAEVGVFTNPELQALYTELVARASVSQAEAIQVGILIEEKDIEDLTVSIAAENQADVVSVYEKLLSGSENHLSSFQRQV